MFRSRALALLSLSAACRDEGLVHAGAESSRRILAALFSAQHRTGGDRQAGAGMIKSTGVRQDGPAPVVRMLVGLKLGDGLPLGIRNLGESCHLSVVVSVSFSLDPLYQPALIIVVY